jgi:purine nucleosidase
MRLAALVILILSSIACPLPPAWAQVGPDSLAPRLLIIDDDVGMLKAEVKKAGTYPAPWLPVTDPDGGLELLYALRDPAVEVLGITCTMGCSTTEVCMHAARRILELAGRSEVPVLRGAASPKELGQPTEAARFIVDAVMSRPGQVEIVATAPLTNIATALMLEPRLPRNWKALHLGTGEFLGALGERSDAYLGRFVGYQDLNINVDPEAARYLLAHGGDFILYPNEIMDDARFTGADRRALKKAATPLALYVADELGPIFKTLGVLNGRGLGTVMYLHGVIPLAVALQPDLAEPPLELRVTMERRRFGGYIFAESEDPAVPSRKLYVRLHDPATLEKRLRERCR